jgi:hypothetical protein
MNRSCTNGCDDMASVGCVLEVQWLALVTPMPLAPLLRVSADCWTTEHPECASFTNCTHWHGTLLTSFFFFFLVELGFEPRPFLLDYFSD